MYIHACTHCVQTTLITQCNYIIVYVVALICWFMCKTSWSSIMAGILCSFRRSKSSPLTLVQNFKSVSRTGSTLFNRSREMDLFKNALQDKPTFSVITRPVNSGKLYLLTESTYSLRRQHIPVLDINLRSVSFNSVDSLVSILEDKGNIWLKQFQKATKYFNLNTKAYGFQFSIGVAGQKIPPIVRLNKLLHLFKAKLPPHTSIVHHR